MVVAGTLSASIVPRDGWIYFKFYGFEDLGALDVISRIGGGTYLSGDTNMVMLSSYDPLGLNSARIKLAWGLPDLAPLGEETPLTIVITNTRGEVELNRGDGADWVDARQGDTVGPGDLIQTGFDSLATLLFSDGSTSVIDKLSHVNIDGYFMTEEDVIRTRLGLRMGQININVKGGGFSNDFQVKTGNVTTAVRGTSFSYEVSSAARDALIAKGFATKEETTALFESATERPGDLVTTVTVFSGEVVVSTSDGQSVLLGGEARQAVIRISDNGVPVIEVDGNVVAPGLT